VVLVAPWLSSAWIGAAGLVGVLAAGLSASALRVQGGDIRSGRYGFNGLLAGAALAAVTGPAWSLRVFAAIVVAAAATAPLDLIATRALARLGHLPTLTIPFNVSVLALLAGFAGPRSSFARIRPTDPVPSLSDAALHRVFARPPGDVVHTLASAAFRGISQIFFVGGTATGVIVLVVILLRSRRLALSCAAGSLLGTAAGLLLNGSGVFRGLWGFNAALACMAVYTLATVGPRARAGLAAVAAIVASVLYGTLAWLLNEARLPALTLAYCAVTLCALGAAQVASSARRPRADGT
jgi:urea transporter